MLLPLALGLLLGELTNWETTIRVKNLTAFLARLLSSILLGRQQIHFTLLSYKQ
jgi:hypothetical protein